MEVFIHGDPNTTRSAGKWYFFSTHGPATLSLARTTMARQREGERSRQGTEETRTKDQKERHDVWRRDGRCSSDPRGVAELRIRVE